MPGSSHSILEHKINLLTLRSDQVVLFIASIPNSNWYSSRQYLAISAYDISNKLLDLSKVNNIANDPSLFNITTTTIEFNQMLKLFVENPNHRDGGGVMFSNFPKNISYFIIEHRNEKGSDWDGVYMNIGI